MVKYHRPMNDLKERVLRGGTAKLIAQVANLVIRTGSMVVLARLLAPKDFGLIGMVTAVIGVLHLFKDFGLSTAAVQQQNCSHEQLSALFWINIYIGAILTALSVAIAPLIVSFYHEPRLWAVTAVLASGFLLNAAGVQHSTILQREMRFVTLAVIDTVGLVVGTVVAVWMAAHGYGYWSLVAMTAVSTGLATVAFWFSTSWVPGRPSMPAEVHSLFRFGGALTLNGLIVYAAYNFEKVLLGRYWGADTVGIYGRAYQLINIPTDNLNSAVGGVVFAALSRLQDDPKRLRTFFLKGYSLVVACTLPISIACAVFAPDIIRVLLGAKWAGAVPIFRLLAPTILCFALINPFSWLLFSLGLVGRSLRIALVIAPLVISGYLIGLPYGPNGVAIAYSVAMMAWVIPHIVWCVKGTPISVRDIFVAVSRPLLSGVGAALIGAFLHGLYDRLGSPLLRLSAEAGLFLTAYAVILLFVAGQKTVYAPLIRSLLRPAPESRTMASA